MIGITLAKIKTMTPSLISRSISLFKPLSNIGNAIMVAVCILLLSGCGVLSRSAAPEVQGPDITTPPVLLGEDRVRATESNPDEEVSYEEWLKRRRAAAAKKIEEDINE